MAWQDRPYYRDDEEPGRPFGRIPQYSITMWLAGILFVMFVLDMLLTGASRSGGISPTRLGAFSVELGVWGLQIWRWLTYQFLHAGFLHLLGNVIALIFFGPLMESYFGSRRFLAFYLLCGMSGALVFTLGTMIPGLLGPWASEAFLVGASGGVFGILIGSAIVAPHTPVSLLFLPITFTIRTLAWVYLGIAVLSVLLGSQNAGGEAAHLGGALAGLIFVKQPWLLGWIGHESLPGGGGGGRRSWFGSKITSAPSRFRQWREDRKTRAEAEIDREVDRILDKVHQHGLQSLTEKEKRTLQRATEQRQKQNG